jgi:hypothetical protein
MLKKEEKKQEKESKVNEEARRTKATADTTARYYKSVIFWSATAVRRWYWFCWFWHTRF